MELIFLLPQKFFTLIFYITITKKSRNLRYECTKTTNKLNKVINPPLFQPHIPVALMLQQ